MSVKLFDNDEKNTLFNELGLELVVLTNGTFRIEEDVSSMKLVLKGIILESELVEALHSMGITKHTLNEIEAYANKYKEEIDVNILLKAIKLYHILDELD